MFTFLSPYKLLIEIALIGSLALGAVWGIHSFLDHEQKIGYDKAVAEYAVKLQDAKDAAKLVEDGLRTQVAEAQAKGNEREKTIRDVVASSVVASTSLRDTLARMRSSIPGATTEALAHSVTTLSTVFDDCQAKYRTMAETADRHASDSKTLSDAWPVAVKPTK